MWRALSPLLMLTACLAVLALIGWGTEDPQERSLSSIGGYDTGSTRESAGREVAPLGASVFVTITATGIEPPILNISVGTEVTFFNATAVTCELEQRNRSQVYMPHLNRGQVAGSANLQSESLRHTYFPFVHGGGEERTQGRQPQDVLPTATPVWPALDVVSNSPFAPGLFSVSIPPGERYTFVFHEVGDFTVMANVGTQLKLTVIVEADSIPPTATATIPVLETPTETATPTGSSVPPATETSSPVPTGMPTGVSSGTPTPTVTVSIAR